MVPASKGGHSTSWNGTTRIESWASDQTFLMVEMQGEQHNDMLELIVRDDRGETLNVDTSGGYSSSGTSRIYLRRFSPASEAKSVTIEMAVNRPLPFEFLFSPQAIEPARPSPRPTSF
jgi:hypothetical protein